MVGGTLSTSSGGEFEVVVRGEFDGGDSELKTTGTVQVADGTFFTISGVIDNSGQITLASSGDPTVLTATGVTTLVGGGDVGVLPDCRWTIGREPFAAELVNAGDRIENEGEALIGGPGPSLVFVNGSGGTIKAAAGVLTINTGSTTVTNQGLVKVLGGLVVDSPFDNTGTLLSKSGSTSLADGGANSGLIDARGGQMSLTGIDASASAGTIEADGGSVTLEGTTSFGGTVMASNGGAIVIDALTFTILNSGTMEAQTGVGFDHKSA